MPFTLAHPAVVLPIRSSPYWQKPALILGSMSPDFVYFLQGHASGNQGHTGWGFLLLNLPLCGLIYGLYIGFINPYFWQNLPSLLQIPPLTSTKNFTFFNCLIFCYSAIVGMITHVMLDSFTHPTGWFVVHFAVFEQVFVGLTLYKWLQYLGGVSGLSFILGYWIYVANSNPSMLTVDKRLKFRYWLRVALLTAVLLLLWQLLAPIGLTLLVHWVIRGIDCGFLALVGIGCWFRHKKT